MIAAVYARKSTDQNGVAHEDRSVVRQVEHARAYAESKGWTVAEDHIYVDDGISGAEFANRPGFLRLMNSLKPRALFGRLVMSEVTSQSIQVSLASAVSLFGLNADRIIETISVSIVDDRSKTKKL